LPEIPKPHSAQEKIYLASKNIFNDYFTIQSSEIRLGKHQFLAPFDGSYAQVYLQEGSIANMGTRVASAIRTDVLELEVPIEVNQVSFLKKGQPVDLLQDGQVITKGSVNRISDYVDSKSQSVLVYVSVPNQGKQKLYEGMYLDARFHGFSLENAMKIPRSAVFNFDEVYLVDSNKLQKARVNVLKVEQDVLYFNGPKEGSTIAVELPLNAADQLHVKTQSVNQ
jgi:RND family efflux transporter MFP subunit